MSRKLSVFLLLFLAAFLQLNAQDNYHPIRVACIGNSITYGVGTNNHFQNSYPGILQQLLGSPYDVRNFGSSGRTMLRKGDYPYLTDPIYKQALAFQPDIVTIALGTNDSKPQNWQYRADFKKDMLEIIATFRALPSKPQIYLCFPPPAIGSTGTIRDKIIKEQIIPTIAAVAKANKLPVIDLYQTLSTHLDCLVDHVHPNEKGATLLAKSIYQALTGKTPPSYDFTQAFPGKKTQWNGFDKYDFTFNGRDAIVVVPPHPAKNRPWIWRPAFFGAFPSVDLALLKKGFHVAYYDVTHLYASPRSIALGNDFYRLMTQYYHLSDKVTVEGFSRGGLFAFDWSAANTHKVACIYVDAPVCNLLSWPGRNKNPDLWKFFLNEWNIHDTDVTSDFKGNAIQAVDPLVKAHIPLIAVCGDNDHTVPYSENMQVVRDAYQRKGGVVELILKKGCDHHPHSLTNPEPVVDFILRYQKGYTQNQHINSRGSLQNAFYKFSHRKNGCVAFLGGSITEMNGWRNRVKEDLKRRFPYTKFTFIDAGIASTGSTPHAFRLKNDVFNKAIPDLMFVEAAVNDDTNGFDYIQQVRAIEGIVRHSLKINPYIDIVMLHFIYDPFIPVFQKRRQPDVIVNHEKVANYYNITSINLAQEIAERMIARQLTWQQFGGTHPNRLGHKYYAATISRLFDLQAQQSVSTTSPQPHTLPAQKLDPYSYDSGHFIPIRQASRLKGFNYIPDWTPQTKDVETRPGFVHVPMLVANTAGASLQLKFKGTAIGIFCVAGPRSAILRYSIDGDPFKKLDTFTPWSSHLYIPWVYMFATQLPDTNHKLVLKIEKAQRTECQIRNFVVNSPSSSVR